MEQDLRWSIAKTGLPLISVEMTTDDGHKGNLCFLIDNIGDLVPPVAVFWYRRFTLSDFSYRLSGTAPESVL